MTKERIAAEIWFHAVVYYIGNHVALLLSALNISISVFNSIYNSSNPATINSKDNREPFFWIVWCGFPYLESIIDPQPMVVGPKIIKPNFLDY